MISSLIVIILGIGLSPLSCIMLWNRYISFTDSLVHACVFGGWIHYIFNLHLAISCGIACFIVFIISYILDNNSQLNSGNKGNILYLSAMSLSAIAIAFKIDYIGLLFGDILFIDENLIFIIILFCIFVFLYIKIFYKQIILISLSKEFANSLKIPVNFVENTSLIIIIAGIILSIYTIGGGFFVIASMMIPAMVANNLSKTPIQMILNASVISIIVNITSILISENYDIAFAPITIIIGFIFYIISNLINKLFIAN
ncbi:MAG: metal ABC transporter permease [Rickettsiales bacterium]